MADDRHRASPTSLRLGDLMEDVTRAAAEQGVTVHRWLLSAVIEKLGKPESRVAA